MLTRDVQVDETVRDNVKLLMIHAFYAFHFRYQYIYEEKSSTKRSAGGNSETFIVASNILYLILTNTFQNQGDKEKILAYLNPLKKAAEEKKQIAIKYFYSHVSEIITTKLYQTSKDQLDLNFPVLDRCRSSYICHLVLYLYGRFNCVLDNQDGFEKLEVYKINTALTAITELFKPHPDISKLDRLLFNYKTEIDKHSFLRKHHLKNDKGNPGNLRYLLADMIKELKLSIEEKPVIIHILKK